MLPKGTHLPPDRTFLPQNPERNVPESARQDTIGGGLSNDQIQDTKMFIRGWDYPLIKVQPRQGF
jgi:hypothetical protein